MKFVKYLSILFLLLFSTTAFSQRFIRDDAGQIWFIDSTTGDTVKVDVTGADWDFVNAGLTARSTTVLDSFTVIVDTLRFWVGSQQYNALKPGAGGSGLSAISAWALLLNNSGSSAVPTGVKISALTDRAAFGAGDKLAIEESTGELRKIDFSDLPGAGGGISNIVEDTTPQLGGDLDANAFDIQFDDADGIHDSNDNEQLIFQLTASAVNFIEITNAAVGGEPLISAAGSDTDVSLTLDGQGAGTVRTLSSNLDITGDIIASGGGTFGGKMNFDFVDVTTTHNLSIIPSSAIGTDDVWHGIHMDLAALDPSGTGADVTGIEIDLSGVDITQNPVIHGLEVDVPIRRDAIHVNEGQVVINNAPDNTAATEFHALDVRVNTANLASTSAWAALSITAVGGSSGEVDALIVRNQIGPIRHEKGTFTTPSQTEFAGERTGGGVTWVDGIDGNEVFSVVEDEILVGSTSQFSQIEIILSTNSSKDMLVNFYYNTAADTWTQFFPDDETSGFQTSSLISWVPSSISALWTNDGDPGAGDTSTGFWIRIERKRNGALTLPVVTTAKVGTVVEYKWDKEGSLLVKDISFEGTTDDANQHLLGTIDPTAARVFNFPDDQLVAGDVLVASDASDLEYLNLATTQILIGDGSGIPTAAALSGGATMTNAGVVTIVTNANLTGPITSVGNATSIASQTGTGTTFVVDTSPTIVTPTIAGTDWTNATHVHLANNSGGTITEASISDLQSYLLNIVGDITPQLGADLDANAFDIQFDDATGIRDDSDNEQLIFQKTASAINHIEITNAAAAGEPLIAAVGGDTDVSLTLDGQGAGTVRTLSSNLDITGNIIVSGTVDGKDIATNAGMINETETLSSAWDLGTPSAMVGTNLSGTGASFTAGVSTLATVTDNESTAEENPVVFVAGADPDGGTLGLETDGTMTYNPSTGTLTTTEFVGGGVGITGVTASHAGTITWTGTSILESGAAFQFGDASDATLTHTYANTGTNVSIAYSTAAMAVTGALTATNLSGTNTGDQDSRSKSISIESPTSSEDITLFFTNVAITVTEMRAVLNNGTSTPSVTWTIRHDASDRSATGAEVVTGGTTTTSVTTGSDVTSFNDATIPADSFVWFVTTAKSGTVPNFSVTIIYDED